METRGVLILDIDGTINPFYARHTIVDHPERLPDFEEYGIADSKFGKANVFLQGSVLADALLELQSMGIELVWGSAWNESSNLILKMLFLGAMEDWPTIIFPEEIDFSPSVQSWKLSTVREFIGANYPDSMPVMWADDEIYGDAEAWLQSRGNHGLLVRPERHRGVTAENWAALLEFAKGLGENRAVAWQSGSAGGSHISRSMD